MTYRNKGLFVGNKLILEDIGLAHFESSANGNNTFLVREKEGNIVRYSAYGNGGVVPGSVGYRIIGDYTREVMTCKSKGYTQAMETARRAGI